MLGGCLQPLFCILLAAIHSQRKKELKVEIRIFGCGFIFFWMFMQIVFDDSLDYPQSMRRA